MISDFSLKIPMSFYRFGYASVPLALIPQNVPRKQLFQGWPLQVLLTPRDLGHLFVLSEMIYKTVCKIFFTENRLAPHVGPDRLFADSPFDKLPVFLLRLFPLPAKLTQYPVCGEARMGLCSARRGEDPEGTLLLTLRGEIIAIFIRPVRYSQLPW